MFARLLDPDESGTAALAKAKENETSRDSHHGDDAPALRAGKFADPVLTDQDTDKKQADRGATRD